jgi:hypothetical protein
MQRVHPLGGPLSAAHTPVVDASPVASMWQPDFAVKVLQSHDQAWLQPSEARENDFAFHAAAGAPDAVGATVPVGGVGLGVEGGHARAPSASAATKTSGEARSMSGSIAATLRRQSARPVATRGLRHVRRMTNGAVRRGPDDARQCWMTRT